MNNLPFSRVSNIAMLGEVPRGSISRPNNQMVLESFIDEGDVLHLSTTSTFNESWQYRFTPNAILTDAVQDMHNLMLQHIPQRGYARVRILYRDKERNVRREVGRSTRDMRRPELIQRTHTTTYHGYREFERAYPDIHNAILFLFESNDLIELEDLHVVLDIDRPIEGGGGRRDSSMIYTGNDVAPSSQGIEGLLPVPQKVDFLCGFIALAMYFAKYSTPSTCQSLFGIDPTFFNYIPIKGQLHNLKRNLERGTAYITALSQNKYAMMYCANFLKKFYGIQNVAFTPSQDCPLILAKSPQLKVVIMGPSMQPRQVHKGTLFCVDSVSIETFIVYIHHDSEANHFHYIDDIKKYVYRFNNVSKFTYKSRRWCHHCYKSLSAKAIISHNCHELKCYKCNIYFATQKEYDSHCRPKNKFAIHSMWDDVFTDENHNTLDLKCENCHVTCHSFECLQMHKFNPANRNNNCHFSSRLVKCERCLKLYKDIDKHNCDPSRILQCYNCEAKHIASDFKNHRCYLKKEKTPEEYDIETEGQKFYAFDFESQFVETLSRTSVNSSGQATVVERVTHEVNFVCVQQCFTNNQWQFDTLSQFVKWLDELRKSIKGPENIIMVAHNLKGYDGRLLYDYYVKQCKIIPTNVMWNGTKLMAMTIEGVLFRDSLLHIATSLENMPKIFALDPDLFAKGFFPYKFNIHANQAYVGPIPDIKYYEPDMMFDSKRKEFLKWYDEQKTSGQLYDFRYELKKYCISDV